MEKRRSTVPLPFQAQYDALLDAYYSLDADVEASSGGAGGVGRTQRKLELQAQMAQLSVAHGELRRALDHYETIHKWIENHESKEEERAAMAVATELPVASVETVDAAQQPEDGGVISDSGKSPPGSDAAAEEELPLRLRAVLGELQINALANISTIHFRLGDAKAAMAHLLKAKQAMRELQERRRATALDETPEASELEDRTESVKALEAALAANYAVLLQAKGATEDAMAAADAALSLARPTDKAQIKENATLATTRQLATEVALSCSRANSESERVRDLSASIAQGLAATPPSDPLILARSHNNAALERFESRDFEPALHHFLAAYKAALGNNPSPRDPKLMATLRYHIGRTLVELGTTVSLPSEGDAVEQVDARQCLALENNPDPLVGVLAQASLAELAFHDGDFSAAEATLTSALAELKQLTETAAERRTPLASKQELVTVQGYMESCLGNAQLANGSYALAEEAHQRDLELALDSEDLHAQLRALRNLALVYSATQRFAEAATLWRETLEIATVLASKRDQMVAYGALGAALHALSVVDHTTGEYRELLSEPENHPRSLFLRQRALAAELGELESQVLAQRQLVGTYEWQPRAEELERRLEECDAFVRLSEQLGSDAALCADAYRALANAINAQIQRLAERGQRFAEAIKVLTFKRNNVLQKLRDASARVTVGAKPRRQALSRVDVVQRPLV